MRCQFLESQMIPRYKDTKFQCPNCNTIATQEWFDANEAGTTAMQIINHLYLDYRSSINVTGQQYIIKFLNKGNQYLN